MAAIDHSAYVSTSPFAGTTATVSRGLNGVVHSIRAYFVYHQTLNSLSRLSRRQLDDIGLDGANIDAVARDMAYRNTL